MISRTSGLLLSKDHKDFFKIESDLHRFVRQFNGSYNEVFFYEDKDDKILIPRYYPINDSIEDLRNDGLDINIETNIIPNSERQKLATNYLLCNNNCILQLEPGSGKTVIAIYVLSKLKKKTIIIAHKDQLLNQWESEILKFTNLEKEDIGRLYARNYKKCLTKSVILTTPQTIASAVSRNNVNFLNALNDAGIGILFIDEVHVAVGPEKFSKASLHIPALRTYGLSATPSRSDGNDDLFQYHLGGIKYFPPGEDELIKPIVNMLHFSFDVYSNHKKYLMWGGEFSVARYYQQMKKADKLNKLVAHWIKKAYDKGRNILVLGYHIEPLLTLAGCCTSINKSDIGIFIPGAKDKDKLLVSDTVDLKEAFYEKRVVFSTYGAARDGNNRPNLDTLIMYCPTSNIEQAIGRILRKCDNKKQPLVLDLVDIDSPEVPHKTEDGVIKTPYFIKQSMKRLKIYNNKNWEVRIQDLSATKV